MSIIVFAFCSFCFDTRRLQPVAEKEAGAALAHLHLHLHLHLHHMQRTRALKLFVRPCTPTHNTNAAFVAALQLVPGLLRASVARGIPSAPLCSLLWQVPFFISASAAAAGAGAAIDHAAMERTLKASMCAAQPAPLVKRAPPSTPASHFLVTGAATRAVLCWVTACRRCSSTSRRAPQLRRCRILFDTHGAQLQTIARTRTQAWVRHPEYGQVNSETKKWVETRISTNA